MIPEDLKYSKTHEWVRIVDGEAVCGITDYAQEQLGDLVFVELPEVGSRPEALKECAVVESVKAASDMYSPLTGTVIAVNQDLPSDPGLANRDPYGEGWFIRLGDVDRSGLDSLMSSTEYEQFLREESK